MGNAIFKEDLYDGLIHQICMRNTNNTTHKLVRSAVQKDPNLNFDRST